MNQRAGLEQAPTRLQSKMSDDTDTLRVTFSEVYTGSEAFDGGEIVVIEPQQVPTAEADDFDKMKY